MIRAYSSLVECYTCRVFYVAGVIDRADLAYSLGLAISATLESSDIPLMIVPVNELSHDYDIVIYYIVINFYQIETELWINNK